MGNPLSPTGPERADFLLTRVLRQPQSLGALPSLREREREGTRTHRPRGGGHISGAQALLASKQALNTAVFPSLVEAISLNRELNRGFCSSPWREETGAHRRLHSWALGAELAEGMSAGQSDS